MNLLIRLELTVLGEFSEILSKVHVLGMVLLLCSRNRTHLCETVGNGLLFRKHHYLLVAENDSLCYTQVDNAEYITLDNEHGHGSLELLAFVDAEV